MKIGYHYTTIEAWQKIKKEGLVPKLIPEKDGFNKSLVRYNLEPFEAIWLWSEKLPNKVHVTEVMARAAFKGVYKIVLLKVKYNVRDKYQTPRGNYVTILHKGAILKNLKHKKHVPCAVITKLIPSSDIELVKEFDLLKLLK